MKIDITGRIVRFDQYKNVYLSYNDNSRSKLENKLRGFYGQKPYFSDGEVRGFKAKPAVGLMVPTSEGTLGPLSDRLLGMDLNLSVKPLKYKFGEKIGVRLQIVEMREREFIS